MLTGMLWTDFDPLRSVIDKADGGGLYYQKKYGKFPNKSHIHPSMMPVAETGKVLTNAGIELIPDRYILPNHFWMRFVE